MLWVCCSHAEVLCKCFIFVKKLSINMFLGFEDDIKYYLRRQLLTASQIRRARISYVNIYGASVQKLNGLRLRTTRATIVFRLLVPSCTTIALRVITVRSLEPLAP